MALWSPSNPLIVLLRGSHWRECITFPADGYAVQAYGPEAAPVPILDASDLITAWSKTGGRSNIYQHTGALEHLGGYTTWVNLAIDGVLIRRAASLIALDAAANHYWVDDDTSATPIIYVHATGGGDPTGDGHTYEYTARLSGLMGAQYDNLRAWDVETRMPAAQSGGFFGRYGADVRRVTVRNSNYHSILSGGGSYVADCSVLDAYTDEALVIAAIECYDPDGTGRTYTAERNHVAMLHPECHPTAYAGHSSGGNVHALRVYSQCSADGCDSIYAGYDCLRTVIANHADTGANLLGATIAVPTEIINSAITVSVNPTQTFAAAVTLKLRNSHLRSTGSGNAIMATNADVNIDMDRSSIDGTSDATYLGGARVRLTATNSAITPIYAWRMPDADAQYTGDYNTYAAGAQFQYRASGWVDFTAWQALTGQDAHSTA